MAAITFVSSGVTAPKGFSANGVLCKIKPSRTTPDLALIVSERLAAAACVYTLNKVKGAPLLVARQNLANKTARAILCNSGNANTCNADGIEKAQAMCRLAGDALHIDPTDVVVASTGVIGQPLPIQPIEQGMPGLVQGLDAGEKGSRLAAQAIMTTDTVPKEVAVEFELNGVKCRMGAIAKGSGMIHPNMATMLCFITTDAAIAAPLLQKALDEDVPDTFNMLSVDGDTSTNDMVCLLANGMAGNPPIEKEDEAFEAFKAALKAVTTDLVRRLAKDGEGAAHLIECRVSGAPNAQTARAVAKSVITSSLFKAAVFGQDANWGRILCAVGYCPGEFDIDRVNISLGSKAGLVQVCQNGAGVRFSEEAAAKALAEDEIIVAVDLAQGESSATAYGCDLTLDYVKINSDYRS